MLPWNLTLVGCIGWKRRNQLVFRSQTAWSRTEWDRAVKVRTEGSRSCDARTFIRASYFGCCRCRRTGLLVLRSPFLGVLRDDVICRALGIQAVASIFTDSVRIRGLGNYRLGRVLLRRSNVRFTLGNGRDRLRWRLKRLKVYRIATFSFESDQIVLSFVQFLKQSQMDRFRLFKP